MRITRFVFFVVGLLILSLGVSFTLKAHLGAGPWDALSAGQSQMIGFTVGTWVIINGIVLLFVNAYLLKKKPEFLAAITFFLIGTLIDFWLLRVFNSWNPSDLSQRVIVLIMGIVLIAVGVAMYMQSHYPANPIDKLMLALQERFRLPLMAAKTIAEVTALILAILVKGPVGIGSLFIAFCIGPIIHILFPKMNRFLIMVGSILK